jgi:hypothetical protein
MRVIGAAGMLAGGLLLTVSSAMAAGFWLYQMGTPDLGALIGEG